MKDNKYEGYDVFKEYFRRASNHPQFNQFTPIQIESAAYGFYIRFGISHHFNPDHCFNTIDGVSSFQFFSDTHKKKEELHSFLELSCIRKEDGWVLDLACEMYTDFMEYNIEQSGLVAFLKSQMHFDIEINTGEVFLGYLSLATKSVAINSITLSELQFSRVFHEMLQHEGDEPAHGIWIPTGSISTLQQNLDWDQRVMAFFPNS